MSSSLAATIGQHFAFASGRTATLKQLLLTQSDADRLLGSHDVAELERILTEIKFTNGIDQSLSDSPTILHALEEWIRAEVTDMTPLYKRPVLDILWLSGDAPLLAYLLKKHHGLISEAAHEPVSSIHAYDPAEVHALIEHDDAGSLWPELVDCVAAIKKEKHPTAQHIDTAVAQCIADRRIALALASGSSDILRYVRHLIDLTNIRTALRLAALPASESSRPESQTVPYLPSETLWEWIRSRPAKADQPHLLTGGSVPLEDLLGSVEHVTCAVGRSMPYTTLHAVLMHHEDAPLEIEHAAARILAEDIAAMWNVPLTVEPVFAFAAIALSHLNLIHAILIAKHNHLSPQEAKQILPPFIPATHFVT